MKRKLIRLQNYDYSNPGYYFVTVCTYQQRNILGEINNNYVGAGPCASPRIILNGIGCMVQSIWVDIPKFYPNIEIDEFIIMPNHMHGIIIMTDKKGRTRGSDPTLSLFDIIQRYKSLTTCEYRKRTKSNKLWQRGYFDHIVRNKESLNKIRNYIRNNPFKET